MWLATVFTCPCVINIIYKVYYIKSFVNKKKYFLRSDIKKLKPIWTIDKRTNLSKQKIVHKFFEKSDEFLFEIVIVKFNSRIGRFGNQNFYYRERVSRTKCVRFVISTWTGKNIVLSWTWNWFNCSDPLWYVLLRHR